METTHVDYTVGALQELNRAIYGLPNDRHYATSLMASRIHRYVTRTLHAVRKEKTENVGYYLAMALSWASALANRLHIELDKELWKRFPGVCPACGSMPCLGENCEKAEFSSRTTTPAPRPATLRGFQKMFAAMYSYHTIKDSAIHLAEEAGQLDEAVMHYLAKNDEMLLEKIVAELADLLSQVCAVATHLKLDMAEEMEAQFGQGCPKCHQTPCNEGYACATVV